MQPQEELISLSQVYAEPMGGWLRIPFVRRRHRHHYYHHQDHQQHQHQHQHQQQQQQQQQQRRRGDASAATAAAAKPRSYNERCREAYEAITAQVLQEEIQIREGDRRQQQQQQQHGAHKEPLALRLLAPNAPWRRQQGRQQQETLRCSPLSPFCCNPVSSQAPSWEEETLSPSFSGSEWQQQHSVHPSRLPLSRGNSNCSSSSNSSRISSPRSNASSNSNSSSRSELTPEGAPSLQQTKEPRVPEQTQSWIPLLRRYCCSSTAAAAAATDSAAAAAASAAAAADESPLRSISSNKQQSDDPLLSAGNSGSSGGPHQLHRGDSQQEEGAPGGPSPSYVRRPSFLPPTSSERLGSGEV
ncbi:uncharacterized protein EMH_0014810 [Eimeria mitis]|uniref:Uncharacterized protein n=1 Tax=Eimeria mitis TaxID=44415 RepID=U6KA53_9EIME|nr:uncharacterized protein EMH_0014810 [Eimeria mitis]CDJ33107.1 hypothetical protein, conserved [Eimeria mitis]